MAGKAHPKKMANTPPMNKPMPPARPAAPQQMKGGTAGYKKGTKSKG